MKALSGTATSSSATIAPNSLTAAQGPDTSTLCPRAQKFTVEQHAAKILGPWHKSAELILEMAKASAKAWNSLGREDRAHLIRKLRPAISRETLSKLVAIGRNEALHNAEIRKHLPSNWTILHKLRDCTAEELGRAVKEGILSRKCSRKAVEAWVAAKGGSTGQVRTARLDSGEDREVEQLVESLLANEPFMQLWKRSPMSVRSPVSRVLMEDSRFDPSSANGMA